MISPTIIISPIQWDIITEIDQANTEHAIPPECPQDKLFVPEMLRKRIIDQFHTALSSGHPGINATIQLLQNRFWWPMLRRDTITQVCQCQVCQTQKPCSQLPAGLTVYSNLYPYHTAVMYVGRNSTVSTGHQKNQRLSKTPPPHPAPKARTFFRSQEQRNVTGTFLKDIRSFHDFQKHLHKKHMDINVVLFLSYACGI